MKPCRAFSTFSQGHGNGRNTTWPLGLQVPVLSPVPKQHYRTHSIITDNYQHSRLTFAATHPRDVRRPPPHNKPAQRRHGEQT